MDRKLAGWWSTSEICSCFASEHQQIRGSSIFWQVLTDQLPQPWLSLCATIVPYFSVESCARLRCGGQSFGSSAVQRKPALWWHTQSFPNSDKPFPSYPCERMENQAASLHLCLPTSGLTHCCAGSSSASALCFVEWSVHWQYRLKL